MGKLIQTMLLIVLSNGMALTQETPAEISSFGERPDSAYLQLLHAVEHSRIEVRLNNGESFSGRPTVTDSGLVVTKIKMRSMTRSDREEKFFPWSQIESLRAIRKGSSFPTTAVAAAASSFGVFMFILFAFSGS